MKLKNWKERKSAEDVKLYQYHKQLVDQNRVKLSNIILW